MECTVIVWLLNSHLRANPSLFVLLCVCVQVQVAGDTVLRDHRRVSVNCHFMHGMYIRYVLTTDNWLQNCISVECLYTMLYGSLKMKGACCFLKLSCMTRDYYNIYNI